MSRGVDDVGAEMVDEVAVGQRAEEACHGAVGEFWTSLDASAWRSLRAAVIEAQAAHRRAMEAAGLEGEAPTDELGAVRERTAAYVTEVAEKVQRPFWDAVAGCLPADRIEDATRQARERSAASCAALPSRAEVARTRPASMPHDPLGRKIGKALARVMYAASSPPPARVVDVRGVATRHRDSRIAEMELSWAIEALRLWSGWMAGLEVSWAAWATSMLSDLAVAGGESVDSVEERWGDALAAASALDAGLERAAAACPHEDFAVGSQLELERCRALLASDLSVAGSFLYRAVPVHEKLGITREAAAWRTWQEQAVARLQLHAVLLRVFVGVRRARVDMVQRLRGELLDTWRERVELARQTLDGMASTLKASRPDTQAEFDEACSAAEAVLTELQAECPDRASLEVLARRVSGMAVGAIQASLGAVPRSLVLHPLPSATRALRRPPGVVNTFGMQDLARQAFDTLRMERVRTAPSPLLDSAEALRSNVAEVTEIVAFGFKAGASELLADSEQGADRALTLAAEGIERAADSLALTLDPMEEALEQLDARVTDELMRGFSAFAARALAHRVQGRLLDLRSRINVGLVELRRRAGPRVERWIQAMRERWLRTQRVASRATSWARDLVGAQAVAPTAATWTARSLATADELVSALPLVYQHLFSLEPVKEAELLAGREDELAAVHSNWRQWNEADGIPLLITGRRGCGISSFFNVFVKRIADAGGVTCHRVLEERITTEQELAIYLSEALGIDGGTSLDDMASVILESPEGTVPELLALEGLEHLYLRVSGGTDLLERLLTLMTETEPRVFWVASLTLSAWQILAKAEPAATAQVDRLELRTLSPEGIRDAVLTRHRRSGIKLVYEEPAEGHRFLRRRVRPLRGTERHQLVLENDYFERLHKTSQGNLSLAYFQWLRSVDFSGDDGQVLVRFLPPLDFSFLDSLDLTQNFTIKAFLEHQTLTLDEHTTIFRVPRQESYHILQSLENRHIIEAVPGPPETPMISNVQADIQYRIQPLLTGAVAGLLASRNIVH